MSSAHTRTSLMRTSDTGGRFSEPEIILPETQALFQRQAQRKQKLLAGTFTHTDTLQSRLTFCSN